MSDDKFDVIIVGAGIAGCTAAYILAKAGLNPLVIERGNSAGSKNMTGGRLYAHSLEKIIPGFATQAPIERIVTHEKISFLTENSAVTIDYQHDKTVDPVQHSYTVLRSQFDQWLMSKAEAVGAQFISGIRVDELVSANGQVTGIKAGDDIIEANVVILAEGANGLLSQSISMGFDQQPHNLAIGVKELIALPESQINERFNLLNNQGTAWLFAGAPTNGLSGGGFLYTNKNSLSLGLVCHLSEIEKANKSIPQMLADFKQHPTIHPLIQGGTLLEYSAHLIPEGGIKAITHLYDNGILVVGDAAGLSLNLGFTVRGMDLAITSAELAAQAVITAKNNNDFTKQGLATYLTSLKESTAFKDMQRYKNRPATLSNPRLFNQYPQIAANIMHDIFTQDGQPNQSLFKTLMKQSKQVGIMNLAKDLIQGIRAR